MVAPIRTRTNRYPSVVMRSIPHSHPALISLLIRTMILIFGLATLAWSVVQLLLRTTNRQDVTEIAVLAAGIVALELLAVRSRDGSTFVATYALLLCANLVQGIEIAVVLGAVSVLVDALRHNHGRADTVQRAALLASLLLAGDTLASGNPVAVRAIMVVWIGAFTAMLVFGSRRWDRMERAGVAAAIVWFLVLLTVQAWPFAAPAQFVDRLGPALARSAGFMTADTMIAAGLGISAAGLGSTARLQSLIPSAFYRYTALTFAGLGLAELHRTAAWVGLLAGVTSLLVVMMAIRLHLQREEALIGTICALSSALDARDAYTRGHSDRVAAYSVGLARRLGWSPRRCRDLELAAHLHDIGKIGVPDAVLLKPGKLSDAEKAQMDTHALRSWEIVRGVPGLRKAADLLRHHHERLDGSGYPDAIAGAEISPGARIMAVADVYDALTSSRPYREAMPPDRALTIIERDRGTKLDDAVVTALRDMIESDDIDVTLRYAYCLSH